MKRTGSVPDGISIGLFIYWHKRKRCDSSATGPKAEGLRNLQEESSQRQAPSRRPGAPSLVHKRFRECPGVPAGTSGGNRGYHNSISTRKSGFKVWSD